MNALPEVSGVSAEEGDRVGWLVTFSDLVLQLFAFVVVAAILESGATSSGPLVAVAARPPESVSGFGVWDVDLPRPRPRENPPEPETDVALAPERLEAPAYAPEDEVVSVSASVEIPPAPVPIVPAPEARLVSLGRYLEELLRSEGVQDAAQVTVENGEVLVSLGETVAFGPGSDIVPTAGRSVLAEVAAVAKRMPEMAVSVSGHTDDRPIRTPRFPSNLHLSLARAARVAEELSKTEPELRSRVVVTGYGAERPVSANDSDEGRAKNRRVEIRLVVDG